MLKKKREIMVRSGHSSGSNCPTNWTVYWAGWTKLAKETLITVSQVLSVDFINISNSGTVVIWEIIPLKCCCKWNILTLTAQKKQNENEKWNSKWN